MSRSAGAVPGVTGWLDSLFDVLDDFVKGEWGRGIIEVTLLPFEAVLALLRNGGRLILIGGVVYLLAPPLISGYVSGKIVKRKRGRR